MCFDIPLRHLYLDKSILIECSKSNDFLLPNCCIGMSSFVSPVTVTLPVEPCKIALGVCFRLSDTYLLDGLTP